MVLLNGGLVEWRSFNQLCLEALSTKTKYISLLECIQTPWYYCYIPQELGGTRRLPYFMRIIRLVFHELPRMASVLNSSEKTTAFSRKH